MGYWEFPKLSGPNKRTPARRDPKIFEPDIVLTKDQL